MHRDWTLPVAVRSALNFDLGQMLQGLLDLLLGMFVIFKFTREIGIIGTHVEVAVAAVTDDDALVLFAPGHIDGRAEGMGGFRGRYKTFGRSKLERSLKNSVLRAGHRLDQLEVREMRKDRCRSVITQPTGMNPRRDKGVAQSEHFHQGS